jgi:hypothetical protein
MDAKQYIELLLPNGRAFNSVEDSEKYNQVLALQIDRVLGWIQYFQDQLWYVNENFDPEPWEKIYDIDVPELSTLEERRQIVKTYMSFPQSQNRLSIDYIQGQLDLAGFNTVTVSTNESGIPSGKLHGNNTTETENFNIGTESYNSINITGTINSVYYDTMLLLLMSLKPLDTVVYDTVTFDLAIALDETLALAYDENLTLALKTI